MVGIWPAKLKNVARIIADAVLSVKQAFLRNMKMQIAHYEVFQKVLFKKRGIWNKRNMRKNGSIALIIW